MGLTVPPSSQTPSSSFRAPFCKRPILAMGTQREHFKGSAKNG